MTTSENDLSFRGQIEISQPSCLAIPFVSVTRRFKQVCKLYSSVYSSITLNAPKLERPKCPSAVGWVNHGVFTCWMAGSQ